MIDRDFSDTKGRILRMKELQRYLNSGRSTCRKIAEEAGAVIKRDRWTGYDRVKIDEYIDRGMTHE